jgi:D-alanyl-D-alanine carboxypeptidase
MTVVGDLATVPAPSLSARAWLTLDVNSGQIIAAVNPDERIDPASLTKIMSAYLVFEALETKRLTLDQPVNVSEKAWKTEGSRMFIKPNTQVTVDELLRGVIVQSGNDATVALAEAVAGSEAAFAALMNDEAAKQGLRDTHFVNSTGLTDPTHLTPVRDLAIWPRTWLPGTRNICTITARRNTPTTRSSRTTATGCSGRILRSTASRRGTRSPPAIAWWPLPCATAAALSQSWWELPAIHRVPKTA